MLKKTYTLLIMIIIVISFTGCANGGYAISTYSDGRVNESFYIELNQVTIELGGYNYEQVKTQVLTAFESIRTNLVDNFNNSENELNAIQKMHFVNQHIRMPSIENNIIGISFLFDSYNDYKLFYGVDTQEDDQDPSNTITEDNIFYIKKTSITKTIFNNTNNSTLATELLNYFSGEPYGSEVFTMEDLNLSYSYATHSTKLRSNADLIYNTASGLKVHEWQVPSNNYSFEIEFYEYKIVSSWWYVLALVLTAVFTITLLFYYKLNSKNTNKEITDQE
jgi:hypothetical protein